MPSCCRTNGESRVAPQLPLNAADPPVPLAADDDQAAAGGEGAAQPRYRVSSEYVDDAVVAHAAVGEVLTGVFDDMVGAERADHLDVADAAHRGELGTGGFGELHGE